MPNNTLARIKLKAAIEATSAQDVHRRTGVMAGALRLLAEGISEPRASTMGRLRVIGVELQDWFVSPEAENA